MEGSVAKCSVEDKPVDCMPNVTKLNVEHNAFYWMSQTATFQLGSVMPAVRWFFKRFLSRGVDKSSWTSLDGVVVFSIFTKSVAKLKPYWNHTEFILKPYWNHTETILKPYWFWLCWLWLVGLSHTRSSQKKSNQSQPEHMINGQWQHDQWQYGDRSP